MPRSRALQPRPGSATAIHIRVPDAELARLERLARRSGKPTTVSEIVRQAIHNHLLLASGRSPFFKVFGRVIEDLADVDVHPILVGPWAAAAHGYLTPTESFDLVFRERDLERLGLFLRARGIDPQPPFPFTIGRRPWCLHLGRGFGGVLAEDIPSMSYAWEATTLEVITLDGLLSFGSDELPDYGMDALRELKAGRYRLDDGERGVVSWDAVGRFTASAFYPDPLTREPYDFVDFRLVQAQ